MMYYARLTSQGQISIPAKVRRVLSLKAGEQIIIHVEKDQATFKRVPDIDELCGIFKTKKKIPFWKIRKGFEEYLASHAVKRV